MFLDTTQISLAWWLANEPFLLFLRAILWLCAYSRFGATNMQYSPDLIDPWMDWGFPSNPPAWQSYWFRINTLTSELLTWWGKNFPKRNRSKLLLSCGYRLVRISPFFFSRKLWFIKQKQKHVGVCTQVWSVCVVFVHKAPGDYCFSGCGIVMSNKYHMFLRRKVQDFSHTQGFWHHWERFYGRGCQRLYACWV